MDDEEFQRWRAEAENALRAASVQADAGLHNWACFAAEQAAQLAVKAFLHGAARAPWGHDLVRLGDELVAAHIRVPTDVADSMRRLGRHYIPARYPDAHPAGPASVHYAASDSREALDDALRILRFVDEAWGAL